MNTSFKPNFKTILLHIGIWCAYFLFLTAFYILVSSKEISEVLTPSSTRAFHTVFPHMVIVYLNFWVLGPKYLLNKRYRLYFFWSFVTLVLVTLVIQFLTVPYFREMLGLDMGHPKDIKRHLSQPRIIKRGGRFKNIGFFIRLFSNFTINGFALLLSSVFILIKQSINKEKETSELKSLNLDSELKFLKSQINPHFLFNSLNTIYGLSITGSENTSKTILKLSALLRYNLYDSKEHQVDIEKEIEYIHNYIDLEKIKDSDIQNVSFQHSNCKNIKVPPLLFLPFIENSFKYSRLDRNKDGFITISMHCEANTLLFSIQNSIDYADRASVGGLGLENVKRRLSLLYEQQYDLDIEEKNNVFSVTLKLSNYAH